MNLKQFTELFKSVFESYEIFSLRDLEISQEKHFDNVYLH